MGKWIFHHTTKEVKYTMDRTGPLDSLSGTTLSQSSCIPGEGPRLIEHGTPLTIRPYCTKEAVHPCPENKKKKKKNKKRRKRKKKARKRETDYFNLNTYKRLYK